MKVIINLGLENNPMRKDFMSEDKADIRTSEWNGKEERTAVYSVDFQGTEEELVETTQWLCKVCKQDCIAIEAGGKGILVYNPNYKGEKTEFNDKYFLR